MNLGGKLQHNMTSCQGLVPADLKANHLPKWILPPHKRGYRFFEFLLYFIPSSPPDPLDSLVLFGREGESTPGSGSPLDKVLLCMAGVNWLI